MPTNTKPVVEISEQRMKAAGARSCEAHERVKLLATVLAEELDEVTANGIPRPALDPEDSVVTAVSVLIAAHQK